MLSSSLICPLLTDLLPASVRCLRSVLHTPFVRHVSSTSAGTLSSMVPTPSAAVLGSHINNCLSPGCGGIPSVDGYVHSTESFSAVDGPGVRFLVFLQGCGMRCLFCSNPDTWPLHMGTKTSTKSIVEEIQHVLPYIKQGGVTCSGGEPLLQPEFVSALFREVHAMGLTTCLDTTGQGTKHHHWDLVLPHTDLVLFCIKHLDPIKYEKLTGMKQPGALKFAHELAERNIPHYLRYVLIPGMSDSPKDIQLLTEFATQQPTLKGIELLPYHVLGKEKWKVMNMKYPLEDIKPPSRQHVLAVRHDIEAAGLMVLCDVR